MATERRESNYLRLESSFHSIQDSPPGIAALFLIRFDIKAGYTIVWKRSVPGVELQDAVEYKALPSGLHNVHEDLIYFVHDQYAGVCAFVNQPAPGTERNALMLAVGVLVPLSYGRLGKSWRHAAGLKDLVHKLIADEEDKQPLSDYWENYQISDDDASSLPESPLDSPSSIRSKTAEPRVVQEQPRRSRAFSDATALMTSKHALTPFHPAHSLPEFIASFGPLIFPLYRAALLRKRILLVGDAPVQLPCNFVYDLSLLASLPHSLLPLLPAGPLPPLRPRPLFNVGIHDIPSLSLPTSGAVPSENTLDPSWIAFTTDHVLKTKSDLYDVLVTLSPPYSKQATKKSHPDITISPAQSGQKNAQPTTLKATQRDGRRYLLLRDGLRQLSRGHTEPDELARDDSDASSTFSSTSIIEPLSWPLLAYTSFIWWASAGEKRAGPSEDEDDQDQQDARLLLANVDNTPNLAYATGASRRRSLILEDHDKQPLEIALVAYFRRHTTKIFTTISDAVARQDDVIHSSYHDDPDQEYQPQEAVYTDNDDDDTTIHHSPDEDPNQPLLQADPMPEEQLLHDDEPVVLSTADMTQMGLDVWSAADRTFIEELVSVWWGRKAEVQGARVKCCGVSIL